MSHEIYRIGALFVFTAVLLLVLGGCIEGGRDKPAPGVLVKESVSVRLGTGGLTAPGRWNLVSVRARAEKGLFRGQIQVEEASHSQESIRREMEVAHEVQTFEVPILVRAQDVVRTTITSAAGLSLDSQENLVAGNDREYRILRIHPGSGEFRYRDLTSRVPDWIGDDGNGPWTSREGQVIARELPLHWLGYDVVDLVILDGSTLASAPSGVIQALDRWVRMGGTLVALPGSEWASRLPPPVIDLLGLAGQPRVDVAARTDSGEGRDWLELAPGAHTSRNPALSLLLHRHGAGRVHVWEHPPRSETLELDVNSRPIWGSIVRDSLARSWSRGHRGAFEELEPRAVSTLRSLSNFSYPERRSVATFVLTYLGGGFCLLVLIFRRFHRTEWAYAITMVLAIVSTIGIYRFGLLTAIQTRSVNSITVASLWPDSRTATYASFLAVESPRRLTLEPRFEPTRGILPLLSQPRSHYEADEEYPALLPSSALDYRQEAGSIEVEELGLLANATRYLRLDGVMELGDRIELESEWVFTLRNGGEEKIVVTEVKSVSHHHLGTCLPGEVLDLDPAESSPRKVPGSSGSKERTLTTFEQRLYQHLQEKLHHRADRRFLVFRIEKELTGSRTLGESGTAVTFLIHES